MSRIMSAGVLKSMIMPFGMIVRVIEIGSGLADVELVDVSAAGRNRRLGDLGRPIHFIGEDQPVPMHRGRFGRPLRTLIRTRSPWTS